MPPKTTDHDRLKAEFAARLSRLMDEKGWNQSDMARAASRYLPNGEEFRRDNIHVYLAKTALPRQKQLVAIAKALGVPPGDLLPSAVGGAKQVPFSMQSIPDEPSHAWLRVDMKLTMRKALAVLAILEER